MTELLTGPVEVRCAGCPPRGATAVDAGGSARCTAECGELVAVRFEGRWRRVEQTVARWLVETEWWRTPLRRDYRRCVLGDASPGECLELWHDRAGGGWWLSRRYD